MRWRRGGERQLSGDFQSRPLFFYRELSMSFWLSWKLHPFNTLLIVYRHSVCCEDMDLWPQLTQCHWQAEDTIYAVFIIAILGGGDCDMPHSLAATHTACVSQRTWSPLLPARARGSNCHINLHSPLTHAWYHHAPPVLCYLYVWILNFNCHQTISTTLQKIS